MRVHALAVATAVALASAVAVPAFAGEADLSGLQSDTTFDQFIAKYKEGAPERSDSLRMNRSLDQATSAIPGLASAQRGTSALRLSHHRRMSLGADVVRTNRKLDRADAESLMRQLASDPNVEYVEVDRIMQAFATPNDTRYPEQWHYHASNNGINLPATWDLSTGSGVVVAVIDTGKISHNDLNANYVGGYDFVSSTTSGNGGSGDGNGRDSDPTDSSNNQHGNHVAGTIAAVTGNSLGVAGVAYNAKVVPLRVLGNGGYGSTSDIVDAIVWASGGSVSGVPSNPNPAEVLNLSLGGSGSCGSTYQNAINTAVNNGSVVVIAAGNSNNNSANFSPGNCNNVINVAATDREGDRAWYSNYGSAITLSAPGGETCSPTARFLPLATTPTSAHCAQQSHPSKGVLSTVASNGYAFYQGTSMAAPHVAGVVALVRAANPSLTPAQVKALLVDTATPIPSDNCPGGCGAGYINPLAAVTEAGGGTPPANNPPTANFTVSTSGLTANFTDTSTDSDGSIASRSWSFGDGTSSTAANPSKTYSSAGTYNVTLTVTDDDGATNSKTSSVTVSSGGGGGSVLQNGVPVTGISGNSGSEQFWTIDVPAGASNLVISTSGGSGDADLYVRFASAPTTSSYNCRPYLNGNNESCSFAAPQTGTYHVMLRGYTSFSGVTLTGSYTAGGGGGTSQTYTNGTDYPISDNSTVESPITVSGRTGNAPSNTPVAVDIRHTYRADLKVDLVAPDGSVYVLHNRTGGSADNIIGTYTVNLSSEPRNGTWRLRVNDNWAGDTGYINSWSITF